MLQDGTRRYFVKLNQPGRLEMFLAEAEGLRELSGTESIRVPAPIAHGTAGNRAFLAMEYLELGLPGTLADVSLGRGLAELHRRTRPEFGWHRDNTIGSTPQCNGSSGNWVDFWREHRLGYQLCLATEKGYGRRLQRSGERLLDALPGFFESYHPVPSLLHGDLWAGNHAADAAGHAVIFDPAVYYGDREADLAMTELFGGFSPDFYAAYRETWPLDAGYSVRRRLYNLYHVLNHLNLFGGGYLEQSARMIEQLLADQA